MKGLDPAVYRPNSQLVHPRRKRSHRLRRDRPGNRTQADTPVDTVHDERAHTAVQLRDSKDLSSRVRPDNSLRLLPKGETDNEGRHALHPILRVLQVFQVLSPSGHRPRLGKPVRGPDSGGDRRLHLADPS